MNDSDKNNPMIKVNNISKNFKLPVEKNNTLKSNFVNILRRKKGYVKQQALHGVSFEVKKGEFFGIVGRNGSGKSTLLKLLAGIYVPSNGSVEINGKMTPFIELGVGFNQDLTGRENIFLNGALLGFNRAEMSAMYDDIVSFAELGKFMDQKLKNYSSGMQVRLAFSISIRVKSDILILDEVLAVGDEAFQRKCLDVFEEYKVNGQTIILVTHDMSTVRRFCSRAILLHEGKILKHGDPEEVTKLYSKLNQEKIDDGMNDILSTKSDLKIKLCDVSGNNKKRFDYGEKMYVNLSWPYDKKMITDVGITIHTSMGERVYAINTFIDAKNVAGSSMSCSFELNIGEGKYYITSGTFSKRPEDMIDFVAHGPSFYVNSESKIKGEGIARLNHQWREN